MARKKKLTIDKYNYGSYVIMNQQKGIPSIPQANFGSSFGSGASTGAQIGGQIVPGMGHLVGGVIGGVAGIFGASSKEKRRREQQNKLDLKSLDAFNLDYENNIDTINENPYGTYADGGEVEPQTQINIEKGELQVDPETGKIIREYTGINPETGGLYESHNKGKDTKNNFVTAEEGTFIITKEKAKDYKDALDNNDKLHQNTIMHNIRNKKRQSMKFAQGGKVIDPITTFAGVKPSVELNTGTRNLIAPTISTGVTASKPNTGPVKLAPLNLNVAQTVAPQQSQGFNWGNLANNAINYLPAVTNLLQGMGSPNYLENQYSPVNPYRNQILSNLPQDIDYSPLMNRVYRDRNTAYGQIDETTNSSAVARANKQNIYANTQRGIQDIYFQGEEYNNRVRGQRAGIYDNLGQQELARFDADRRFNFGVDMTNRQMAEGRRQQVNYGLSQLQQMYQSLNTNKQLENRDNMRTRILEQIFPALLPYLNNIYGQGGTNGSR